MFNSFLVDFADSWSIFLSSSTFSSQKSNHTCEFPSDKANRPKFRLNYNKFLSELRDSHNHHAGENSFYYSLYETLWELIAEYKWKSHRSVETNHSGKLDKVSDLFFAFEGGYFYNRNDYMEAAEVYGLFHHTLLHRCHKCSLRNPSQHTRD